MIDASVIVHERGDPALVGEYVPALSLRLATEEGRSADGRAKPKGGLSGHG